MLKHYSRRIGIFVGGLLLMMPLPLAAQPRDSGPRGVEDWDPISLTLSGPGGSLIYEHPSCARTGDCRSSQPVRASSPSARLALESPPEKRCYFPRGGRFNQQATKSLHAAAIEVGRFDLDDSEASGGEDDVAYISAGYRRHVLHCLRHDRFQLNVGGGLALYSPDSGDELGFNLRIGGEFGINTGALKKAKPYFTVWAALVYHNVSSDLDTVDAVAGLRVHLPSGPRGRERAQSTSRFTSSPQR